MQNGSDITIGEEAWHSMAVEAEILGRQHFSETDDNVEPRRPWKLDMDLMARIYDSGCLSITAARDNGKLIGYCFWQIAPDVESEGLLIATHGPWFALPEYRGVGLKCLMKSLDIIKAKGVKCCFPHHRLQGRGADLGKLYKRLGATETQHTYSLWIGD